MEFLIYMFYNKEWTVECPEPTISTFRILLKE